MVTNNLNFALIGCGYWGSNYLRILKTVSSSVLIKVCDTDLNRLNALIGQHPFIEFTDDIEQVVNDPHIDAVIVCTPVITHFDLTKSLLRSGKHVLCEKPLTINSKQCDYLLELANKMELILLTGHVFEYNSVLQYMRKMIKEDSIGEVLYMQFARMGLGPVRHDVNVVFDLAAHDVGIAISIMGTMPVAVSANGSCFLQKNLEDVAFIQLEFPNKIFAGINVSWLDPIKQRLVKVVGSKKMLMFDDVSVSDKLKIIETGTNYQINAGDFGSFQLSIKDGEIVIPNLPYPEPLITEFNHFIACVKGKEQPLTDAAYATRIVKVLEAVQESINHNGEKIVIF